MLKQVLHYQHEASETLKLSPIGFLQIQIVECLQKLSKSIEINFLTGFFEISKVNNTCKACHIKVQCAR